MKASKLLLIAAAALSFNATVSAYDNVDFGVKGGIALNMMPGTGMDAFDSFKPNIGFQAGGFASMAITDMLIGQVELLYSRKGVTTINHALDDYTDPIKYTRNIHYIQVPVLIGFYSLLDNRFQLLVGPELNICAGNEIKTNDISQYEWGNLVPAPVNLGLGLQATYFIFDSLGIDLKLDFGLTRTLKYSDDYIKLMKPATKYPDKGHNAALQIGVSYRFGY